MFEQSGRENWSELPVSDVNCSSFERRAPVVTWLATLLLNRMSDKATAHMNSPCMTPDGVEMVSTWWRTEGIWRPHMKYDSIWWWSANTSGRHTHK